MRRLQRGAWNTRDRPYVSWSTRLASFPSRLNLTLVSSRETSTKMSVHSEWLSNGNNNDISIPIREEMLRVAGRFVLFKTIHSYNLQNTLYKFRSKMGLPHILNRKVIQHIAYKTHTTIKRIQEYIATELGYKCFFFFFFYSVVQIQGV